jgi:hypothetical protein
LGGNVTAPKTVVFPSVDDICPVEQGGPIARAGFTYQDEVAVSFVVEMLQSPRLVKLHCETHDDVLLVWATDAGNIAEFVQVKGGELDKLWSIADLCRREGGVPGRSIYETSLGRDGHSEASSFRIVTLRPVVGELEFLTYPFGAPGREAASQHVLKVKDDIETRCPSATSPKGNGAPFWLERCLWEVRHDWLAVARANELALLRLAAQEQLNLLPEHIEILLEELRRWIRTAGAAKWEPDRDQKILTRIALREWWERRAEELKINAASSAGGRLVEKLRDAGVADETIALAVDLRRNYSAAVRTSRYAGDDEYARLQDRVKSELIALRARYAAGVIDTSGVGFHVLCLDRLDAINKERPTGSSDQAAFLLGCMYDITDRCLHRFARPAP